jgi:hypothetical protein
MAEVQNADGYPGGREQQELEVEFGQPLTFVVSTQVSFAIKCVVIVTGFVMTLVVECLTERCLHFARKGGGLKTERQFV